MAYEVFSRESQVLSTHELFATVTACGQGRRIGFSAPIAKWLRSHSVGYCELLWDAESRKAAVKPLPQKTPNSYKLVGSKSQAWMGAVSFLKFIGDPTKGRYEASINEQEQLVEVSFANPKEK